MNRPIRRTHNGFTLLEIMIVLVIIGVMSALAVPYFGNSIGNLKLKASARETASALRYARSLAASEKIACLSVFDTKKGRLVIGQESVQTDIFPNYSDKSDTKNQKVYELPNGIRFKTVSTDPIESASDKYQIAFYPAGNSSGGEILIEDEHENRFHIRVDFVTGTVKLDEVEKE